jgi:hypothetical protein
MLHDNLVIWASFTEAWYSSSAGTILARRSCSTAFVKTRIEKNSTIISRAHWLMQRDLKILLPNG